jgi:O-antigen ligase/polysaccharide polymerase Wzy-like membrane protein
MRAADLRSSPARLRRGPLFDLDRARLETIARTAMFIVLGVAAGVAGALSPLALVIGAAGLAFIWLIAWRSRPQRVFFRALIVLLIGYAFLGRGLAHVGVPPLYVGEVVLGLGVLATLVTVRTFPGGAVRLSIVAFMAWGALQTIPYLGRDGINAVRDAVTWGYALFALIVSVSITARHFDRILAIYRAWIPLYCLWVPALLIFSRLPLAESAGDDYAILGAKPGDMGVFLAGIAAFALLGLYSSPPKPRVPEAVMWILWLPAAAMVAIYNRGGLLAILTAGAVIFFLRLPQRWLAPIFFTLLIAVSVVWVDPKMDIGQGRTLSVAQLVENFTSIVSEGDSSALEGTKEFRLRWWGDIINYTINGPYFWTGKGFGVNLADDDGFQVYADHSLRAPHNGHIEILARTGVPGLILWILMNAAIGIGLLRAAARARSLGRTRWVAIDGWLFVCWAGALVNASFDPYLQGPHGGIWFWSLVGLAIVAIEASRKPDEEPLPAPAPETRSRPPHVAGRLPRPA